MHNVSLKHPNRVWNFSCHTVCNLSLHRDHRAWGPSGSWDHRSLLYFLVEDCFSPHWPFWEEQELFEAVATLPLSLISSSASFPCSRSASWSGVRRPSRASNHYSETKIRQIQHSIRSFWKSGTLLSPLKIVFTNMYHEHLCSQISHFVVGVLLTFKQT